MVAAAFTPTALSKTVNLLSMADIFASMPVILPSIADIFPSMREIPLSIDMNRLSKDASSSAAACPLIVTDPRRFESGVGLRQHDRHPRLASLDRQPTSPELPYVSQVAGHGGGRSHRRAH